MNDLAALAWKGVRIVNLTRQTVSITDEEGNAALTIPPSGQQAWARYPLKKVGHHPQLGIPIYVQDEPVISGLPAPEDGVIYIVSTPVLMALYEEGNFRADVFSPGQIVKGPDGRITGCIGLRSINAQVGV